MKIGILALQGAVQPHVEKFNELGVETLEVRTPAQLEQAAAIVLPGGESTTMLHLLRLNHLWEPLQTFVRSKPTWGVCAGAILLADQVTSPSQQSLKALSLTADRNAFGRQIDSFIDSIDLSEDFPEKKVEGVFIRAPRFRNCSPQIKILGTWKGEPVMALENQVLVSSFHPELSSGTMLHKYFCNLVSK